MMEASYTNSRTATDPLLHGTTQSTASDHSLKQLHDVTNSRPSPDTEKPSCSAVENMLRTAAMLCMVGFGLVVIFLIFSWPSIVLWSKMMPSSKVWLRFLCLLAVQVLHVLALIFIDFPYLYLHRKVCLPIRILLMPLLNFIIRSEAIRERETTWYNDCKCFSKPSITSATGHDQHSPCLGDVVPLLQKFSRSSRKDTKQKLRLYLRHGIVSETKHSDYMSLRRDIPILWDHERRCCQKDDSRVLGEFIKRFLVMFLVPHAYLDRYYNQQKCCALGMFVVCDNVLLNSMYFCLDDACQCGIWQYHSVRGLLRAVTAFYGDIDDDDEIVVDSCRSIEYINYFQHQDCAKRLVGARPARETNSELMRVLFPFRFYREPPSSIIALQIDLSTMAALPEKKSSQ